jgi:phenylalanyl-tRNA synthetase beta chain
MNTSLTKETYYQNSENFKEENHIRILNPLSVDLNMMRRNLLFGGLETIAYNSNRKNHDLKLFELGRTYSKTANEKFSYGEEKHFSLFVCGRRFTENPYGQNQTEDISSLRSYVDELLNRLGISGLKISESTGESFSNGLSYSWKNKILLELGQVKKNILKQFDIKSEVFYADINWELLVKAASSTSIVYHEVPKFPSVRRDLALLLDKKIKYKQIHDLAFSTEKKFLKEVNLFDVFEGEKIGPEKKSYAVSFTLQDEEATLTDKQIESIMQKLIKAYEEKLGASLR